MKIPALVVASILVSSTAYANNVVVGCQLMNRYSESDVSMLLAKARSVISDHEVNQIYGRYVVLKNACQTNSNASSIVPVSANLRNWLAENGVNIGR